MKHTWYKCEKVHDDGGYSCQFCAGGLGWCLVCDGFEGTCPTECPGYKLDEETKEDIWKRGKDFIGGEWVVIST